MPDGFSIERLPDLLIDPRESLFFELKSWLDLREPRDKATLAKALMALANHGGGAVAIGLEENGARVDEAPNRPPNFDGYTQDLVNGIVQSYADPEFHCSVHFVRNPAGRIYPLIVVPGGFKTPVLAKRAGPNQTEIEIYACYVRKPGPRSENARTSSDWDALLRRCFDNRREDFLDQIRTIVQGVPALPPQAVAVDELRDWATSCFARWEELRRSVPPESGPACPHGFYWFAYQLVGDVKNIDVATLPDLLRQSQVRHSGWPPFVLLTRPPLRPYLMDDVLECWVGAEHTDASYADAAHSDFWRVSQQGFAFLLRGFQEDTGEIRGANNQPVQPATAFDVTLPVWRVGETFLHAEQLAKAMMEGPASVKFLAHYDGLAGRELKDLNGRRFIHDGRIARQNSIDLSTRVEAASIGSNLPEIIQPLLAPLYALFDFFPLPPPLVKEELTNLRSRQF